jgi:hypothetical protein
VERLFVMAPPGYAQDRPAAGAVSSTRRCPGVRRVVTMSASGVEASDEIPLRRLGEEVERSACPERT